MKMELSFVMHDALFVLYYGCVWKRKRLVWFFCQVAQVITTSLYIIIINVEY